MNSLREILQILFAVLLVAGFSALSQAAGLAELRQQYELGSCNHDHVRMVKSLRSYRRELWRDGRRNLQADFMLASCLCPSPGSAALSKLPGRYRGLSTEDTEQILDAAIKCRGGRLARYLPPGTGVAFVGGKGSMHEELVEHLHSQMTPDAVLKYESRLFSRDKVAQALQNLHQRGFSRVLAGDNFLVAGNYGSDELRSINTLMDRVLQRLAGQFGMAPPRTLITVYLFNTKEQLRQHAREVHDLKISQGTWAYTFPLDASISIWRSGGAGTVGHEVMHALLEQNLPYAPPWLNEGSAALFEEFKLFDENSISGTFRRDHWRIPFLDQNKVPSLRNLLEMDWTRLDHPQRFQVNHATAKMFALFLQEQGKLGAMLNAYKGRDLFELGDDIRVVEQTLGMSLEQLEERFRAWLHGMLSWSNDNHNLTDQQVFEQLHLDNNARFLYIRTGYNWYQWTAFIDGPSEAQTRIARVKYLLHPTFTPNEQVGDASRPGHPFTTKGWGVFNLRALVTLDSGGTKEYAHYLQF